jgi:E3 ubiquitin-protein ligase HERC3
MAQQLPGLLGLLCLVMQPCSTAIGGEQFIPLPLVTGGWHTCAVLEKVAADGVTHAQVKCWGRNADQECGTGDSRDRGAVPGDMGSALPAVQLGTGRRPVQVAVGRGVGGTSGGAGGHTCVLLEVDAGAPGRTLPSELKCFGSNRHGQVGASYTGAMGDMLQPVALGSGRRPVAVAAGGERTCVIVEVEGSGAPPTPA